MTPTVQVVTHHATGQAYMLLSPLTGGCWFVRLVGWLVVDDPAKVDAAAGAGALVCTPNQAIHVREGAADIRHVMARHGLTAGDYDD